MGALEEGRSPLLLTERKDHLEYFARRVKGFARNVIVLKGGMGQNQRREIREKMKAIPDSEERLIIATGRYVGEGFDDARLDTLFLTLPISWRGTLSNMSAVFTGPTTTNGSLRCTTTSIPKSPCLPACTKNG